MKAYVKGERHWIALIACILFLSLISDLGASEPVEPTEFRVPEMIVIGATECVLPERVRDSIPGAPAVVRLATYAIGRYEVTTEEYCDFAENGGYQRKEFWSPEGWHYRVEGDWTQPISWPPGYKYRPQQRRQPIIGLSWYEAEAYLNWLKSIDPRHDYRFPTELEWVYAAIGPDFRKWPWGNEWDPQLCNFGDTAEGSWYPTGLLDGYRPLAPFRSYERGRSFFGCYNMCGNVEEWCQQWFDTKGLTEEELSRRIIKNPVGLYKVARGGHWLTARVSNLNPLRRAGGFPFVRRIFYTTAGLRVCYSVN